MTELDDATEDSALEPPSKSSRKRAALAAQKMGERLTRMRPTRLPDCRSPKRCVTPLPKRGDSPAAALSRASTSSLAS